MMLKEVVDLEGNLKWPRGNLAQLNRRTMVVKVALVERLVLKAELVSFMFRQRRLLMSNGRCCLRKRIQLRNIR